MIYYANGCSYTWGGTLYKFEGIDELTNKRYHLPSEPTHRINLERLKVVYPHHLGRLIGAENTINESLGGGSNYRIVRKTLEYFNNLLLNDVDISNHFVTIQWTEPSRKEFFDEITESWVHLLNKTLICENNPKNTNLFFDTHKFYYKYLQSDLLDFQNFIAHVYLLGNFFTMHKIPYLFFMHADFLHPYIQHNKIMSRDNFRKLFEKFNWINNDCLNCFMYKSGIEDLLPEGSHPSQKGHIQWANLVYQYLKTTKILKIKADNL